jgi:hypothetical protein
MGYNSNSVVWMACIVLLESQVVHISNSCLDVQAIELDFYEIGQYICYVCIYYSPHIINVYHIHQIGSILHLFLDNMQVKEVTLYHIHQLIVSKISIN